MIKRVGKIWYLDPPPFIPHLPGMCAPGDPYLLHSDLHIPVLDLGISLMLSRVVQGCTRG